MQMKDGLKKEKRGEVIKKGLGVLSAQEKENPEFKCLNCQPIYP